MLRADPTPSAARPCAPDHEAELPDERAAMAELLQRHPARVTPHLANLIARSEAVARQFLPDVREALSSRGFERTFVGLLPTGVRGLERMYPDRCVVMPTNYCPAYCRFCFRKAYRGPDGRPMSEAEQNAALAYIAADVRLHEVLITGGEPLLDLTRLARLLDGLRTIEHVGPIRVACRSLITEPTLIDDQLVALLQTHQDLGRGRPIEVALHCNHADELSDPTIERLVALRRAGIHVYNQSVLLRGINDNSAALLRLLRKLRDHGVESYHLYLPDPVQGTEHLRPTLAEALGLKTALRREATGRVNPALIVTTRVGKVEPGVDAEIVAREQDGRHLWFRTPYTLDGFRAIDRAFELPTDTRLAPDGRIDVRYLDGAPVD